MTSPVLGDPLSAFGNGLGLPVFCIGTIFFAFRGISRLLTRTFYRLEDSLFYTASLFSFLVWIGDWVSWGNNGSVDTFNDKTREFSLTTAGQIQTVATEVLSVITLVIWKSYLLVMYCRIFEPGPAMKVFYAVLGLIGLHAMLGVIGSVAQCVPISMLGKFMGGDNPNQSCMSGQAYAAVFFLPDLISALTVLLLPLFYLKQKHWTTLAKVAFGWMSTAALAIIVFTIMGMVSTIKRYTSDPWYAATELFPLYVSFFYMLIGCYGELHPLFSKEHRRRMRENEAPPAYRLGSIRYSQDNYTQGRPFVSSPILEAHTLSRNSSVGERFPKYIV